MKIRLLIDLPVDKEYGMTKGRELEVVQINLVNQSPAYWFVMGDTGVKVGVLKQEAEVIEKEEL